MSWLAALLDPSLVAAGLGGSGALGFVGAKFRRMEAEIRECRARDSRFVVIEAGFRMVVGEMQRKDPQNETLQRTSDLLNKAFGNPAPSFGDFDDLIRAIDKEDRNADRTARP